MEDSVKTLPPLARVVILSDLVAAADQQASVRNAAVDMLLALATATSPAAGFRDSLIGLLRGVSLRDMHAMVARRSVASLLASWGVVAPEVRQRLSTLPATVVSAAFEDVLSEGRSSREHASFAARCFGPAATASVLLKFMADPDESVRHRAVESLEAMTAHAVTCTDPVDPLLVLMAPKAIKTAGEDATVRRQAAACMLALWTPATIKRCGSEGWLSDPGVVPAVATAIRWCTLPLAAARAAEWIHRDGLAKTSTDRLSTIETPAERAAALSRWHLLSRPIRASKLRGMKVNISVVRPAATLPGKGAGVSVGARGLVPTASELASLPLEARMGAAVLGSVIGAEAPIRAQLAARLLADRDSRARIAGRSLATVAGLADFAFDTDEHLARGAAMRWLDLARGGERLKRSEVDQAATIEALRRSPHACVRAMAVGIEPPVADSREADASLRQRLAHRHHPTGQLEALGELRTHDRLVSCVGSVIALLEDQTIDARVRAKAAATLGRMHDGTSLRALTNAASKGERDPRVLANAIDALRRRRAELGASATAQILELKSSACHQRVRASAIRLLAAIKTPDTDAAGDVLDLLKDPRPAHRRSGAWLAGRLARLAVDPTVRLRWSAELRHMCDHGTDPGLRARASQALTRIQPDHAPAFDDWATMAHRSGFESSLLQEHAA